MTDPYDTWTTTVKDTLNKRPSPSLSDEELQSILTDKAPSMAQTMTDEDGLQSVLTDKAPSVTKSMPTEDPTITQPDKIAESPEEHDIMGLLQPLEDSDDDTVAQAVFKKKDYQYGLIFHHHYFGIPMKVKRERHEAKKTKLERKLERKFKRLEAEQGVLVNKITRLFQEKVYSKEEHEMFEKMFAKVQVED